MSEPRLISPMLDNFMMGGPISDHHGVRCCPAMENGTDDRYIVKVISVPASPAQMDALLISGAYKDEASALDYYRGIADEILKEVDVLQALSELEWFIPFKSHQLVPMESGKGFEIYLLSTYKRTLQKHFKRHIFTHLDALNLGLDICSALSMCRRNGYLYVDLKPSNIYVADQRLFRIGDLGFVSIESLKYASLPEKYQSIYTPPEVRDAFSALNLTMDIYAAGLILYQAYNNGELPFNDEIKVGDVLPAPLYADYEISEIILKACATNPDDRWQDPVEMRQAIINYMQRNGALDIPIVPIPSEDEEEAVETSDEASLDETSLDSDTDASLDKPDNAITQDEVSQDELPEIEEDVLPENSANEETSDSCTGEASCDTNSTSDIDASDNNNMNEIASEDSAFNDDEEIDAVPEDYTEITEEVSEMLNQADELASLDVPDPVVVPDHVDIPEPDPIVSEENDTEEEIKEDSPNEACDEDETDEDIDDEISEAVENLIAPLKKIHWVRNTIVLLTILALLVGGIYYYKNHYLLTIEDIAVEGNKDRLTVIVTTDIDESLLQVVCSDTYGNKIRADVIDGKAEFTGLVPNTAYKIKISAKGFHKPTGSASTAYSTPIQTNIVQFDAIAGSSEDSVILNFTAEGPSSNEWTVEYFADGVDTQTATFIDSQMVTITNLIVGKEYTFRLVPKQALYLSGQTELTFTPSKLIRAEKINVTSCVDNKLTLNWSSPEGETVSGWSVRCHNEEYSQTIVTTENTVTFEGLDHTDAFEIEIKAIGMSVSAKTSIPANSVTVSDFKIDTANPSVFALSWKPSITISEDGWTLCYSIVGLGVNEKIPCKENNAKIESVIPNATYRIHLEDVNGITLLGSQVEVTAGAAQNFSMNLGSYTLVKDDLTFYMCKTPARPNWGRYDLSDDDYTSTFTVGQSASFLVRSKKDCYSANNDCITMFVVRDKNGNALMASQQNNIWSSMWSSYNCKLEIPTMPTNAGTYIIEVYFNGGLAHQQEFTIQ